MRQLTHGRGVDICVDSIGKLTHLTCIKALTYGGVYVTCGCTTGADATTDLARIFWNRLHIIGSTMGSRDEFREVFALFSTGKLNPIIDQVYPAQEGRQAFARLESGQQMGKCVIQWI